MCNHDVRTEMYQEKYELKDGKQLVIRMPELRDAQALIDYMKEVDCETKFLAREPGEFGFTLEQEENFISGLTTDDSKQFLIAEVEGQIVANCSVGFLSSNRRYLHRAGLGISVKQDKWGLGIGRIMMKESISWCKEKGVEQLELEVVTNNERAVGLYKSLGFDTYGTKKHALRYSDGTYADEYFMILFLGTMKE
ncbi:GNAT family N-acetyltransferase [Vallitaleaceae bacterium 9-2]